MIDTEEKALKFAEEAMYNVIFNYTKYGIKKITFDIRVFKKDLKYIVVVTEYYKAHGFEMRYRLKEDLLDIFV